VVTGTSLPSGRTVAAPGALPDLPALVVGAVTHHRPAPVRHVFGHRVYQWLIDLDTIPAQPWYLRPFARFVSADHLGDPGLPIKANVEQFLASNGIRLGHGSRVLMLANARVLGYVFNPLSVFWCYDSDGTLSGVVAEVHNTHGQRHCYLVRPDSTGLASTAKAFPVSPFFDVSGRYTLRVALRPDLVSTSVTLHQDDRVAFSATFRGRPTPATRAALARQIGRQPFMPQRVSALIRMHGVWLWLRRVPLSPRLHPTSQEGVRR
jgi:DUF1365 family protein